MTNKSYHWPNAQPPVAEIKPHTRVVHQDTVVDNYFWMNDYFKKGSDSTQVIKYLEAENTYLDTMMKGTKNLQTELFDEMKARIKTDDESAPYYQNGYYYYTRTEEGNEYFKFCRKKDNLNSPEEVLLDVDKMAEGYAYFAAVGFNVSPDNKLLAYGIDTVSRRQYTIHIKNLETGEVFQDRLSNTTGGSVWANDNETLFYTAKNEVTLLSEKIKKHKIGTDIDTDKVVYQETDPSNYIAVSKAKSGQFIYIHSQATTSSETRFISADRPNDPFVVFQPRIKNVLYDVISLDDKFLILTNLDAQNFRLMETNFSETGVDNWKEIIPHRPDVLLEDVDEFKHYIVVSEREDGLTKLNIRNLTNGNSSYLDFGEPAYMAYTSNNREFDFAKLRYNYSSLTTSNSTFEYNLETGEKELLKQQEVLGDYSSDNYVAERTYATARDGQRIPISLVYRKDLQKSAQTPLLLYAYGSYGNSIDASFSSNRLSLLNRGFIFAIAHVRGGQEMGRQWYEDGKMMNKKNTFTDFIDCAEYLIEEQYTSAEHLYAQGGSAGGLLMGAVINMRPKLWNGVIAQVPFVDVVNTMLDETIPLTTNEFDEWGNPKEKGAYDYMKSYSPYENVVKQDYPNLLVTTGLHDSQVQYFEPAKWVAKLRATKTGDQVVLLHTNMEFGHGGASGRFDYLKDIALSYAFLFALEGIEE
ncbi:S9 family peptidase [Albibacterium indicum]|uniref:S9 family peptidase n=1 Tax=Albibacterium indicum TaxID=2292082 RepID=UPI000E5381AD|nr:S9 family peptidase [Pedobacter indicus]